MVVVLYSTDFEPIVPVDLPMWIIEHLEKFGEVRVAVVEPNAGFLQGTKIPSTDANDMPTVIIRCETIPWFDGTLKSVIVAEDDELALALKCDWLPGQRQAINNYSDTVKELSRRLIKALKK